MKRIYFWGIGQCCRQFNGGISKIVCEFQSEAYNYYLIGDYIFVCKFT